MSDPLPVYLDTAATTPVDPRVADLVMACMLSDFGNAGSRTHGYGSRAARLVEQAREQVAAVVAADPADVVFTSGATEADNLAIFGLAAFGQETGRRHIVTTALEHKAVSEPMARLAEQGFEVECIGADPSGAVDAAAVAGAVRPDTLLVSVMHVNNETGIRQPISEIAEALDPAVFFHTDAAQSFGKIAGELSNARIDLISISGHKVFAPKGVGALIVRRRGRRRPPLQPILLGGGQERGLRPGTLSVPLIAGLGLAAELAHKERDSRLVPVEATRELLVGSVLRAGGVVNGDPDRSIPHIMNVSFPGLDSEAVILALRSVAAVSNGSACTSSRYEPSHVLTAMGLDEDRRRGAIRLSWSHATPAPDADAIVRAVTGLR